MGEVLTTSQSNCATALTKSHVHLQNVPASTPPANEQTGFYPVIEFWTFIPLFLFFNTFNWCFQDASEWVTEGLVLKL